MNASYFETVISPVFPILHKSRDWWNLASCKAPIHRAIIDAFNSGFPCSEPWHVVLSWPTISEDGQRIAYFQNEEKAKRGLKTVTNIGKFITRYWPTMPAHFVRDISAKYTLTVQILDNLDEMIDAVINGPHSCMAKDFSPQPHPYSVYLPEYGWRLAVRKHEGEIIGRALLNEESKSFVRCYAKSSEGYAGAADEQLRAYLIGMGYSHARSWESGTRISKIEFRGDIVGPYIDGDIDNGDDCGEYVRLCRFGELEFNNTSGLTEPAGRCSCEDCGERFHEDDLTYIEDHGSVCNSCLDDWFYFEGDRLHRWAGQGYYRERYTTVTIEGDRYPDEYLSEYDIVELHTGDFTHLDNAVYAEDAGEYYHADDVGTDIAFCEDTGDYRTEYWYCEGSRNYYSDEIEPIEIDGNKYHPDNMPTDENQMGLDI